MGIAVSSRPFTAWGSRVRRPDEERPQDLARPPLQRLPWKKPTPPQRELLQEAGPAIKHALATLEQLYHPTKTPAALKEAHSRADLAVGGLLACPPISNYYELAEFMLLQHHKLQG